MKRHCAVVKFVKNKPDVDMRHDDVCPSMRSVKTTTKKEKIDTATDFNMQANITNKSTDCKSQRSSEINYDVQPTT